MRLRNTIGILPCDVASHKIRKDMLESSAGVECRSMVLWVTLNRHAASAATTRVHRLLEIVRRGTTLQVACLVLVRGLSCSYVNVALAPQDKDQRRRRL